MTYIHRCEVRGKACWSVEPPGDVMIEHIGLALLRIAIRLYTYQDFCDVTYLHGNRALGIVRLVPDCRQVCG